MRRPVEKDQSGHVVGPGKGQDDHEMPPLMTGTEVVQLACNTHTEAKLVLRNTSTRPTNVSHTHGMMVHATFCKDPYHTHIYIVVA